MNEDLTRNLPQSFEERVLAELSAIRQEQAAQREMIGHLNDRLNSLDAPLTSLEDKVDSRLRETRPIWEGVQERLTGIESELQSLNRQFRSLIADLFQMRVPVEKLEDKQPAA